jgi:hypothetical protein
LLKNLNAGFDEIGTSPTERKSFMDLLADLQFSALRAEKQKRADPAKPAAAEKPRPDAAAPTLQVSHATDSGVRVQDISLSESQDLGAENTPDRADLRRVRQLVRGDWVDFITAGQSRRERLTWINTSRTLFLFSNSAAACAISITPEALAVRLRNRTAEHRDVRPADVRARHPRRHPLAGQARLRRGIRPRSRQQSRAASRSIAATGMCLGANWNGDGPTS